MNLKIVKNKLLFLKEEEIAYLLGRERKILRRKRLRKRTYCLIIKSGDDFTHRLRKRGKWGKKKAGLPGKKILKRCEDIKYKNRQRNLTNWLNNEKD